MNPNEMAAGTARAKLIEVATELCWACGVHPWTPPCGPAFGCPKSLPAILSRRSPQPTRYRDFVKIFVGQHTSPSSLNHAVNVVRVTHDKADLRVLPINSMTSALKIPSKRPIPMANAK